MGTDDETRGHHKSVKIGPKGEYMWLKSEKVTKMVEVWGEQEEWESRQLRKRNYIWRCWEIWRNLLLCVLINKNFRKTENSCDSLNKHLKGLCQKKKDPMQCYFPHHLTVKFLKGITFANSITFAKSTREMPAQNFSIFWASGAHFQNSGASPEVIQDHECQSKNKLSTSKKSKQKQAVYIHRNCHQASTINSTLNSVYKCSS